MALAMDDHLASVTRGDFERLAAELREEVVAAVAESVGARERELLSDVLGQLRMLKWSLGFALVAITGALGFLYQGLNDLGVELRAEMRSEIGGLRTEMRSEIGGLRAELRSEIAALREETHREFTAVRRELASLGERVARLEAGQTFILGRLDELTSRVRAPETQGGAGAVPESPRSDEAVLQPF